MDEAAAAALDAQTGERQAGARPAHRAVSHFSSGRGTDDGERIPYDSGGASRFFYCAKASRGERGEGNLHPTVKPAALMRWLVRLACPPGGVVLDPFAGSGTTGLACVAEGRDAILIEREAAYYDIAARRIAAAEAARQLPLAPAAD